MRTGRVAAEILDRVRDRLRRLADGEPLDASTEQVETDADPEYTLWIEDVVAPARAAVEAAEAAAQLGPGERSLAGPPRLRAVPGAAEGSATGPRAAPAAPTPRRGWRRRRLVQIATLPLAASIAWLLAGTPGWRHDPQVATLMLAAGTRTGGEPTMTLEPDTDVVELRVDLGGDDEYRSFRAILTTLAGVEVWRAAELAPSVTEWGSEVVVRLPAERLPAGDYELALEGVGAGGEVRKVGFYSFRVTESP